MEQLYDMLETYHDIFSVDDGEQGDISLVEFNIVTGEAAPIKYMIHRVPFAA